MTMVALIISVFGFLYGVWELLLATKTVFILAILVIPLIPMAVSDFLRWVAEIPKRKAAKARQEAFLVEAERALTEYCMEHPEAGDVDENGIPYL